jgi:hypothetical protein
VAVRISTFEGRRMERPGKREQKIHVTSRPHKEELQTTAAAVNVISPNVTNEACVSNGLIRPQKLVC